MVKAKPLTSKRDDQDHSKRFEEAAREAEADESGKTFECVVKVLVSVPKIRDETDR